MLQAIPTKHGTGVKFVGDYGDLKTLHETFWKLMPESRLIPKRERNRLLTVMSYEIRHAHQHESLTSDGKHTVCDYESNFGDIEIIW